MVRSCSDVLRVLLQPNQEIQHVVYNFDTRLKKLFYDQLDELNLDAVVAAVDAPEDAGGKTNTPSSPLDRSY